jgi:hypothetical protein
LGFVELKRDRLSGVILTYNFNYLIKNMIK